VLPNDGNPPLKLTNATVAGLTLPAGKSDAIFFDDSLPGFGVRLRAGGGRTWICQYRVGTKQRRIKLGVVGALDAEKARLAAKNRLAQVALGGDPQADKVVARTKAATTISSIIEGYLAAKTNLRPKTLEETERYLRKHWRPLHGVPVHQIDRRTIAAHLTGISVENGPVAAVRARAALSALFAWAVGQGLADENAVVGTNRPAQSTSRDRVLTDIEMRQIWSACRDDDYGRIIKLLMLTGQRRDEVGAMTWSEIDTNRGTWCIPAGRTKNRRQHAITLPPLALSIIYLVERRPGMERIFGRGADGFGGWSKAKAALDARILKSRQEFVGTTGDPADAATPIRPWILHDIRRSVATRMGEFGVLPHVIEAMLNHVSGHRSGVAGVYNRSNYEADVKAALVLWSEYLAGLVMGGVHRVVVPFKRP
jgi:integrase